MRESVLKEIEVFVHQQLEYWKVPGCIVSVFNEKEVFFIQALGLNSIEKKQKMGISTVFSIGSCRKSMTSAAVASLVDIKRIEWNQPVRKYFPDFELKSRYATNFLSVADILSHKTNVGKNNLFWDFYPWERKDLLKLIKEFECCESFNHVINYNNLMYSVVEYFIEFLSGNSFENFIKKQLWDKIGMLNSGTGIDNMCMYPDIINNYNYYSNEFHLIPYWLKSSKKNIFMNIWDVIRWVQFFMNKGKVDGKPIVSYNNLYQCIIPQTFIPLKKDIYFRNDVAIKKSFLFYGMGWFIQIYRGKTLLYHEGKEFGSNLYISYMPNEDIGVALLFNKEDYKIPHIISYYLYDLFVFKDIIDWFGYYKENFIEKKYYHTNMKVGQSVFDNKVASQYQGKYCNAILGDIIIYWQDNKIRLKYFDLDIPLQKIGEWYVGIPDKEYVCPKNRIGYDNGLYLKFEFQQKKVVKILIRNDDSMPDLEFKKIK